MGINLTMRQGAVSLIEEGEYVAQLERIDVREGRYLDSYGNPIPVLNFVFRITEGNMAGKEVIGLASSVLTPGNKLDCWLRALGADTINVGETFDTDSVIGAYAKIYVEHKNVTINGQIVKRHYISKVKSYRPIYSKAAPQAQAGTNIPPQQPVMKPQFQKQQVVAQQTTIQQQPVIQQQTITQPKPNFVQSNQNQTICRQQPVSGVDSIVSEEDIVW